MLNTAGIAYTAQGTHDDLYYRSFPKAKVYFVTQEFGTYKPLRVVAALRDENRAYHHGGDSRGTKQALREVFNPANEAWRSAILRLGREVITSGLALAFETPAI